MVPTQPPDNTNASGSDTARTDTAGTNAAGADAAGTNATGADAAGTNATGADSTCTKPGTGAAITPCRRKRTSLLDTSRNVNDQLSCKPRNRRLRSSQMAEKKKRAEE